MILLLWEILAGKGGEKMERFGCGASVVSGEDALSALGELNCRRLLLVTQPEWIRLGLADRIVKAAGDPETEYIELTDPEPTMFQAVEGSRKIQTFHPDLVAALGDRCALDLGKAMTCFSNYSCTLAAIPTVFGSGSEVTDQVSLAHNGRRHLLQNRAMAPDLAILDSSLTAHLTQNQIGEGGFELLAAALEAHAARAGPFQAIHAREAFASCWAVLPAAFAGNPAARKRLQVASVLAGLGQTGPGLCRALENSLGIVFGLSRGKAAAMLLPAVIGCNAHAAGRRYAELSRAAGLGGSREDIGIRNLRAGLVRLRRELGLPGTLVQAGVDIRSVWSRGKQVVELTLEDPACRNNPVTVDDFVVRRLLEEITGRI